MRNLRKKYFRFCLIAQKIAQNSLRFMRKNSAKVHQKKFARLRKRFSYFVETLDSYYFFLVRSISSLCVFCRIQEFVQGGLNLFLSRWGGGWLSTLWGLKTPLDFIGPGGAQLSPPDCAFGLVHRKKFFFQKKI